MNIIGYEHYKNNVLLIRQHIGKCIINIENILINIMIIIYDVHKI